VRGILSQEQQALRPPTLSNVDHYCRVGSAANASYTDFKSMLMMRAGVKGDLVFPGACVHMLFVF